MRFLSALVAEEQSRFRDWRGEGAHLRYVLETYVCKACGRQGAEVVPFLGPQASEARSSEESK